MTSGSWLSAASRSLLSSLMCSVVALACSCHKARQSGQAGFFKNCLFLFHGREKRMGRLGGGTLTSFITYCGGLVNNIVSNIDQIHPPSREIVGA
jgi:hypothetical protein